METGVVAEDGCRGLHFENSAFGKVTCSEHCALIHAQECEVRVKLVQQSVPAHVVKRTVDVDQYIEYSLRSECVIQMLV